MTDREFELLQSILNGSEGRSALEDMDNALGWVVTTTEHNIGRVRVYGLFDQPAAALECACAAERVRRDHLDSDDWSVQVYPLLPP